MKNLNLFIALLMATTVSYAQASAVNPTCDTYLEKLPTQQAGRDKPLYVHATEVIKYLTGKSKLGDMPAVNAYCALSLAKQYPEAKPEVLVYVLHTDLLKFLDLPADTKSVKISSLLSKFDLIGSEYMGIKEETSYKKSLKSLAEKINLYNNLIEGKNWKVPYFGGHQTKTKDEILWYSIYDLSMVKKDLVFDYNYFKDLTNKYIEIKTDHYLLELTYVKLHLSRWAMLASILAALTVVLFRNQFIALTFAMSAVAIQITILVMRVMISGRAPITNMYETVLFSGFGALLLALIIGHFKKERLLILIGSCYNICTLFMLTFANEMLDSAIKPLVPVLRDNFWLSTHVTTIILSYGALALTWVLANYVLIRRRFYDLTKKEDKYYADLIYSCTIVGVILLAAGIILGGVWADYSWGRFWGWDPKETWSLIVLCIYMAILHGKSTSWIPPRFFATCTAGAFMSVMMAWFGVNYILASGLHSYGFSQGGALFLGTFFAAQTALLVITSDKIRNSIK